MTDRKKSLPWRVGRKVEFFHFVILLVVGSAGLTVFMLASTALGCP
jgi:hypothetical protein